MTPVPDLSPLTSFWSDTSLLQAEPPDDLWSRIASARSRQLRRRAQMRNASGLLVAGFAVALVFLGPRWAGIPLRNDDAVDWQARAQVLELQLAAVDRSHNPESASGAVDVEAELGEIDRRLQIAYESKGADAARYANELMPLWKRRSELLNTLILTRQQGLALTRI
jgi:hypothetical protein